MLRDSTVASSSPRPVPNAVPPCSANGTSLPSRAASMRKSRRGTPSSHSEFIATSTAAASALPPAMPPATGMDLSMRIETSGARPTCSAISSAARQARLRSSVGSLSAPSPTSSSDSTSALRTVTSSSSETAWNTVVSSW
ncbi:hypothetical protein BN971_04908 [Mycobacterium bohemicum DSM 44277]|uniref:Uncharacterized protein n=1 Tax=Mycobacterium bohemicum DSM 44277 TaxID=1236609 RepID=A0A0U0WEU9_MYCBE|nr:hypothetical protein BN971_04908 [Mycobacterium bohemicum DSM 44277]